MNIFRLQLMVELLKEMEVAIPVFEVSGLASADQFDTQVEVTRTIESFSLSDWTNALGHYCDMKRPACGYSACAVGHAMFDVRFNALGLQVENGSPKYGDKIDWEAVQAFFEIGNDTAHILFSEDTYDWSVQPNDIAERIQLLLRDGELGLANEFYDDLDDTDY